MDTDEDDPMRHAFVPNIDFTNVEIFLASQRRRAFTIAMTKWAKGDPARTVIPFQKPGAVEPPDGPFIEATEPKRLVSSPSVPTAATPVSKEQVAAFLAAVLTFLQERGGVAISTTKLIKRIKAGAVAGSGTYPTTPQCRALLDRGAASGERPFASVGLPQVRAFRREDGALCWVWESGQKDGPRQHTLPSRAEDTLPRQSNETVPRAPSS